MPSLPQSLLHPLAASTFVRDFPWRHPLKYTATKFTDPSAHRDSGRQRTQVCVIFITGVGCILRLTAAASHLYIPLARHLYRLSKTPDSPIELLSVWVVDRPNHGEAALLNASVLEKEYAKFFPYAAYGTAISELITSGLLSPAERNGLVAVGHSGGCGAILEAFPRGTPCPFKSIVMMEAPCTENTPETTAVFRMIQKVVAISNGKMPTTWPSVAAAMEYFSHRLPWSSFDEENLRIMAATFFMPVPGQDDAVTTITPAAQRSAAFSDIETCYDTTERISAMLNDIPVTAIMGTVQDLWPAPMAEAIEEKIGQMKGAGMFVTYIEGAGHHVPHEKPEATARALIEAFSKLAPVRPKL
ncbi:hypothetical protein EXIGLDRAFT_696101 [Exidia glandulosa HHB12029]|uniref:AB hydrolase-1 domain-containing protein n=1 Tax=Exidia glandulosa HHB12029 TaxID=1314781 RepID=A0A165N9Y9_EXIGL|nr:hypothetical protein EXIGLDRAFT_696101 [Exidia glandulosa HHB12029]